MRTRHNKRALQVIRELRRRQETQSRQIDILCSDMVSAHSQFSQKQARMNFTVSCYEALLACVDRPSLLGTAIRCIEANITEAGCAVFLLEDNGYSTHTGPEGIGGDIEKEHLQDWFCQPLVDQISQMNRVCTLEQLLRMGLQGPPAMLKTISAAALPLGRFGQGLGFLFLYRHAGHPLTSEELSRVAAVTTGLRQALERFDERGVEIHSTNTDEKTV
ncbi:MAG: hypothetical protein ACYSUT_09615 [Planctomycetota bacterium]